MLTRIQKCAGPAAAARPTSPVGCREPPTGAPLSSSRRWHQCSKGTTTVALVSSASSPSAPAVGAARAAPQVPVSRPWRGHPDSGVSAGGRVFTYPNHVLEGDVGQEQLYAAFMPQRVEAFLAGTNVNIMAYGQTGSGKTHTMFGPPGIMAAAASGSFGTAVEPSYGLFPRGLLDVYQRVQQARADSGPGETTFALTASAVELTWSEGNLDMFLKACDRQTVTTGATTCSTVHVDKAFKPPRLYGMVERPMEVEADLLALFEAISVRNTAGTGSNDTSSRSHCFAFLTLRALDVASGTLRTSRFQFVDLAGSERMSTAHGGAAPSSGMKAFEGMCTNYSLTMLGQCIRDLVDKRAKKTMKTFSFRTYMFDLVLLLQDSLMGTASTLVVICCSAAPDNAQISKQALEFGEVFSRLDVRPPAENRGESASNVHAQAVRELAKAQAGAGGAGRYAIIRRSQTQDQEQLLAVLEALGVAPSTKC